MTLYSEDLEFKPDHKRKDFYFSEEEFFRKSGDLNIKDIKESKFYLVYHPDLVLREYMPEVFLKIREKNQELFKKESNANSFLSKENIFKLKNLEGLDGGRSDAFIFMTSDEKFMIKVLTKQDKKVFLKILPEYFRRIESGSKLVKIFGLFNLRKEKINFILMENLTPDRKNNVIFDLKGSFLNRRTQIKSFPVTDIVLKDSNFNDSKIKIKLENKNILHELTQDFEFLYKFDIIDYSLILGIPQKSIEPGKETISSEFISIGIVDIFQVYNLKKVAEKKMKSIIHDPREISSTDPKSYCERIIKFVQDYVFVNQSL